MLNFTTSENGGVFKVNAALKGFGVYLDHFAIMDLAEGDPERRACFLSSIHSGAAELLFSVSNVVDLTGPRGASLEAAREFLDEIGPRWFPVELDARLVVEQEKAGVGPAMNCLSERFLRDFVGARLRARDDELIINLSSDFFRLSGILEWIGPQRDSIRSGLGALDDALRNRITGYVEKHRRDPEWLDRAFPAVPRNPAMPATVAYFNLVRNLVIETTSGRKIKTGDGLDFCHAVVACGCATVAMLDKHWKRRIEAFPRPSGAPPIFYARELDDLVANLHARTQPHAAPSH